MNLVLRRALVLSLLILLVVCIGTCGYMIFAGYSFFEAIYMSAMTVTTIGYGEIRPLGHAGRVFNLFFMLLGSGTLLLAIGLMTGTVLDLRLGDLYQKRRTKRMIDKLSGHIIVCGFGRVGRGAAQELKRSGVSFLVVDRNEDRVEWAIKLGMLGVLGDSTRDEALRDVGIEKAKGLVAALATDADNLFLTVSAKQLNPRIIISARANEEDAENKLRRAGAESVFAPYYFTGSRLAQSVLKPHVTQFLDFTTHSVGLNVAIEQVRVSEHSEYVSKSLRELANLRKDFGISVLAIRRAAGQMIVNPSPEEAVNGGDYLIVMGEPEALRRLERLFAEVQA